MASGEVTVHVDVRGLERVKLFAHEFQLLVDDMRVGASPFAERAERILDRFMADIAGDENGPARREPPGP